MEEEVQGKFVPVGSTPNYYLLAEIVNDARMKFVGDYLTPAKMAELKYYINDRVDALIHYGKWQTMSSHEDRIIKFVRIEVLESEDGLSDLRIVPRWEYEEGK